MGRWWDEQWYMEKGNAIVELIKQGNFNEPFWYKEGADHPPVSTYVYGLASYLDKTSYDPHGVSIFPNMPKGVTTFRYDLTYTRLVSVIISSLAVVLVFFFGVRYFSFFVGTIAALILAMLPHFLGFSQLVTLESWIVLFFTACVFSYCLYLETGRKKFLALTGILTGFCLQVKQSDILILLFYFLAFFLWKKIAKKQNIVLSHFSLLGVIAIITSVIIYPIPILHPLGFFSFTYNLWFHNGGRVHELLFGVHMGARGFFYLAAFFVTTPLLILLFCALGIKAAILARKKWIYPTLLIWFSVPFFMSFFHHRQNMVRYIIEFYAPLSLLAAIGLEQLMKRFTKKAFMHYGAGFLLLVYLLMILLQSTPYYLTYFNELVGGTKNVYEKKLFFIGWFGEGLRGPGIYIAEHASKNAKIGMALNPEQTLYKSPQLRYETFTPKHQYEYVVDNYFNSIRIGFDENVLKKDYTLVYTEKADGADLAHVFKHK